MDLVVEEPDLARLVPGACCCPEFVYRDLRMLGGGEEEISVSVVSGGHSSGECSRQEASLEEEHTRLALKYAM